MSKQYFSEEYGLKPPENYERFFVPAIGEPVAYDLIRLAALRSGERVLDVACGTGIVARLGSLLGPQPTTAPRIIRKRPRLHVGRLNAERRQTGTHLLAVNAYMVQRLHDNHVGMCLVCAVVQSDDLFPINRLA